MKHSSLDKSLKSFSLIYIALLGVISSLYFICWPFYAVSFLIEVVDEYFTIFRVFDPKFTFFLVPFKLEFILITAFEACDLSESNFVAL